MSVPNIDALILDFPTVMEANAGLERRINDLAEDWRVASRIARRGLLRFVLRPIRKVVRTVAEAFSRLHKIVAALGESVYAGILYAIEKVSYPAPPGDKKWPLERIGLEGALSASGVRIAHVDTGYSEHAEVEGAFSWDLGVDLIDGELPPSAEDDGFLGETFKHHGTRTGAILASRDSGALRGAACDAVVIPIRAVHSPLLITDGDYARVADAIDKACDLGAKVISMSLGGLWPNYRLEQALVNARERDVVVVAAAGQPMRKVTYPGRYSTVITAAATTHEGHAAEWSARGRAVDVAAPGQGIWVPDPGKGTNTLMHSWGTSYATAFTAGAAALWLNEYGHQIGKGRVVETFSRALRAGDFESVVDGDPLDFGAGQLDVERLMRVTPQQAAEAEVHGEAPLRPIPVSWGDTLGATKVRILAGQPELRDLIAAYPLQWQGELGAAAPRRQYSSAQQRLFAQELAVHEAFSSGTDVATAILPERSLLMKQVPGEFRESFTAMDPRDPIPEASLELKSYLRGDIGWG